MNPSRKLFKLNLSFYPSPPDDGRQSSCSSSESSAASCSAPAAPPTHHHPSGAGFRNPWPSALSSQSNLQLLINNGIPLELARKQDPELRPVKTLPADLKLYCSPDQPRRSRAGASIVATWLGHAGYLVQFPPTAHTLPSARPFRVLFDPIFSLRASPTQWTGPKRIQPSPCHIEQIPLVDACLISHSHYDHLDFDTIKELYKRQPHIMYYVPLGLKAWFDTVPVPASQIVELDWWDSCVPRGSPVTITCVPAQHSSGRTLLDQNSTLWCGWIVEQDLSTLEESEGDPPVVLPVQGANQRPQRCCVYFAGDTGYRSPQNRDLICPAFKEIGEKFGPIDFSMIPIWRGGSLSFISWAGLRLADSNLLAAHHASPEDAVRIHADVRSRHTVGIHHSCFVGSEAESVECLAELERAKKVAGVGQVGQVGGFGVVNVGQTVLVLVGEQVKDRERR